MRERPIIFNSEMVRAILGGRKTTTRRVCKDQTPQKYWFGKNLKMIPDGKEIYTGWVKDINGVGIGIPSKCPYGVHGNRLWVRETFFLYEDVPFYKADSCVPLGMPVKWKPSIFMPRWASRISLEITNIRVERLQEISEEDAIKEGVEPFGGMWIDCDRYRKSFRELWNSINKKYPWSSNPWVFVISFKRLDTPD